MSHATLAAVPPAASVLRLGRRRRAPKWLTAAALVACGRSGDAVVLRGAERPVSVAGANGTADSFVADNASHAVIGGAGSYPRGPRIYFLFLAVDKVSNMEVWNTFFSRAHPHQYRAYVHCKFESCMQQVAGTALVAVPTVPSYYCTDLVSPMNQLINVALQDGDGLPNEADKFAFISDSTLPAKPFSFVYGVLAARHGSDFCVFPSNEWADVPNSNGGIDVAVKYHQWITLGRAHAQKSWDLWKTGHWHHFMPHFRMNQNSSAWATHGFGDSHNFGCLDEFWHMLAIYGPLQHPGSQHAQDKHLDAFIGGPLRMSANAGWQGECDTFVMWSKYVHHPGSNPFGALYDNLDPPSVPHGGNYARPGWWDRISSQGLRAIRQSSFLFVRKFIDRPSMADSSSFAPAYVNLVLSS